jgi:hypothetical protein
MVYALAAANASASHKALAATLNLEREAFEPVLLYLSLRCSPCF